MEKPDRTTSRKKMKPSSSKIDRLSAFTDDIILHILSFLPTKTSVSTSILARRWRFMWAHVPNLHFDYDRIDTIYNKVVLHYKVENMNVFRLKSNDSGRSMPQFEACIEDAINRKVKQIDLSCISTFYCFPSRVFSCKTVVDLKLPCLPRMESTGNVCLPALKKLYIFWVLKQSPEPLSYLLLSGCPVLEELTLERLMDSVDGLVVSSREIKRLDIGSAFGGSANNRFTVKIDTPEVRYLKVHDYVAKEISVAGPLVSLVEADIRLDNSGVSQDDSDDDDDDIDDDDVDNDDEDDTDDDDCDDDDDIYDDDDTDDDDIYDDDDTDDDDKDDELIEGVTNDVFDCDDDATVDGGDDDDVSNDVSDCDDDATVKGDDDDVTDKDDLYNKAPSEEDVHYARSALEFVGTLSNVKYLKLRTCWIRVSDSEFFSSCTVKFDNLTKLELRSDLRFITIFLENADNLEALTIEEDTNYLKHWIEPKEVPACLLSHLQIVRINYFQCGDQEFDMIKYILWNANVLKRMEIKLECDGIGLETRYEAVHKISLFPKGSLECELSFC